MTFYRPILRCYFALAFVCALPSLANASDTSQGLSALPVDCETLKSPQGLSLNGPWVFKSTLSPAEALEPELVGDSKVSLKLPVSFAALREHFELSSEIAEAWMLLRLPSDCDLESLGLRVENAMSASRIDLISGNTRTVIRHGTLGTNSETEIPLWFSTVTKLPVNDGLIWVRYQVTNFHHARGGFQYSPILGDYRSLSTDLHWERLRDMGLFGFIIMMCLYHLILFALRRKDSSSLAFAILCMVIAARHLVTSRFYQLSAEEPSQDAFVLLLRLEYITMYLALAGFSVFIYTILPKPWLKRFVQLVGIAMAVYCLITIWGDPIFFTGLINGYYAILGISSVVALVHLIRVVSEGEHAALLVLGGLMIVVATAISDVLKANDLHDLPYMVGYGLGAFLLVQSYILAKRFADAQEAVESSLQVAEEASQLKSEFLANMSHELRTPLNAIVNIPGPLLAHFSHKDLWVCAGCDSVFEDDGESDPEEAAPDCPECGWTLVKETQSSFVGNIPEHTKFLTRIERSGRHLLNVINDLLDFSKLDAGKMVIYPENHDGQALVRDAMATLESLAEGKGITLEVDEHAAPKTLYCDQVKLTQVLVNLTGNAVKFTEEGGRVTLRVSSSESGYVRLSVQDTGIGIASEDLSAIFESFRQADGSHTRKHQGTGLGLAISKKIVELHGGTLSVSSEVGVGSTFTIELPNQPDQA